MGKSVEFFFPRNYDEHHNHIVANAEKFVACDFRGRATYAKVECKTQAQAERAALRLIAERKDNPYRQGAPVLVYAVKGPHQVVAATVRP